MSDIPLPGAQPQHSHPTQTRQHARHEHGNRIPHAEARGHEADLVPRARLPAPLRAHPCVVADGDEVALVARQVLDKGDVAGVEADEDEGESCGEGGQGQEGKAREGWHGRVGC